MSTSKLKQAVSENGATRNCIGCIKDLGVVSSLFGVVYLLALWLISLIVLNLLINVN